MSEKTNLIGFDFNINEDFLEKAVHETVLMGISESLNKKNEIVSQIVKMVLTTKVDKTGKISSYARDNTQTLLEYYVRGLIEEITKEELQRLVSQHRKEIKNIIQKELKKEVTIDTFVNKFISGVECAISNQYVPKIQVFFEE